MVAVNFYDLSLAFEFVGFAAPSENNAYVCLDTGQIYCTSELNPLDEEVPDDLETSDRYLLLPHKTGLDLGKRLALRFTENELPDCCDRVAGFFRHKGAYARFKDLLDSEGALERWYKYEADATERALREWCAENSIQLIERNADSAAQPVDAPDHLPGGLRPLANGRQPCTLGDLRGRQDMSTSNKNTREGIAPTLPPPMQLFLMSEGVVVSTALSLAAELGIADLLADGPRSGDELAKITSTHPRSLHRVLRLLSSVGVFTEVQPGRFALTSLGECLRTGVPGSMRSWLRMVGLKVWFHTYGDALYSLRTGEPAFARTVGAELFDYLATHPEEGEIFNSAMSDFGQGVAAAVLQGYDFSDVDTVVDVGGGNGSFISAILRANPRMTGILMDLPHVAEGARKSIVDAGLAKRCDIAGGDFFMSIPAGGDAYVLRWIIHDWDHDRALTILRNCRNAMKRTARLLLVETVIPAGDEPHPGKLVDFVMLTALGGQERTAEEYERLLDEAGFRLKRIVPTASPMSVVEGTLR